MGLKSKTGKTEKGGKKGGKKDAKDKNKMTQVDKTFYELTIADLNQKLSRLRAYVVTLEESQGSFKEKLRNLEEDRSDVAAHLERTLAERNDKIASLEEQLLELTKVRNQEKEECAQHIKDLEVKYKAMHDQLTSEIKLLNGKLNSLDEFRIQRDKLLAKFDEQEAESKEKERQNQETLYMLEQKAVLEKDAMKKEVLAKLLQVSEDFTRSSEIRNAGYTRRLIRENIALQKEIEILIASQLKMQQDFVQEGEKHKEIAQQYAALDELKTQLIYNSQNQINIIEKLTDKYERLRAKYTEVFKYRNLYEQLMTRDVCTHFVQNDTSKKLHALGQKVEALKLENSNLMALNQQQEYEIVALKGVMKQIKDTIMTAINVTKECDVIDSKRITIANGSDTVSSKETEEELDGIRKLTRANLLSELMNIISSNEANILKISSISTVIRSDSSLYRPGKMGFLPRSYPSLMEIFKRDPCAQTISIEHSEEIELKEEHSKIIPKERTREAGSIFDVELGSTLYVSSSHEDLDVDQVEEEPVEYGEEGSSSEDNYRPQPEEREEKQQQDTQPNTQPSSLKSDERSSELIFSEEDSLYRLKSESSRASRLQRMSQAAIFPSTDNEAYNIQLNN